MKSKAKTLNAIRDNLSKFLVPDFDYFTVSDWLADEASVLTRLILRFKSQNVAVRSSAQDEDSAFQTQAGAYDSVLNVPVSDEKLTAAILKVIASYSQRNSNIDENEIIIQRMVGPTIMSGVAFSHDLNTGAPYYVINYDDVSGRTNTVTAGEGEYSNRTIYIHRLATEALRSLRFRILIEAIQELERVMESEFLDVEFAIGEDLTPYLLQVRLITTQPNWNRAVAKRVSETIKGIEAFVGNRFKPAIGIFGQTTVLGQMPDWNPAEMLGRAPRALALSLYQTLITNYAWRRAREIMGYAVPIGQPLMVSLAGQPFIDTRMSFHSYLPATLDPRICEKLVNSWVSKLSKHPELHDKIEFDIAITAFSFDFEERIATQTGVDLSDIEKNKFRSALLSLTRRLIFEDIDSSISTALSKVEKLAAKSITWRTTERGHNLSMLYPLIDDCIQLGTVPFSILARHAFIARSILISLKRRGVLDDAVIDSFHASIITVASELVADMRKMQAGEISRTEFMERYGHLRPGTYDILSQRYDCIPDLGLYTKSQKIELSTPSFELDVIQRRNINELLTLEGFPELNADSLFDYFRRAIVGREYAKFVFTRNISAILELIAEFGNRHGLSREELSHIKINQLLDIATESAEINVEDRLRRIAEAEVDHHALGASIRLPQVLFDQAGVHIVPFQVSQPNFITALQVTAPCLHMEHNISPNKLGGHIVLIENADPGFDWIFSQPISGLITKYGGANSHMAIRCAEFGIPAAIGCGEQRFESLRISRHIMLDCSTASIKILY